MLHHQFGTVVRRSRFQLAVTVTALALIVGAGPAAGTAARPTAPAAAAPTAYDPTTVNVGWTKVISGLSQPVLVTHAGDGSGRLFVVQQGGKIRVFKGGVLLAASFLDLSANVLNSGEQGLLGLAFHPSFESNGKFYVYFTLKSTRAQVVNEYRVAAPYTADTAAWQTGRRILTMADPYSNHNGGHMAFGPDGYLYIGTGDGGGSGDPAENAQDKSSLLGKMLRIDPHRRNGRRYTPAPGNPYVGEDGRDEIYARGLRNPWRFSFDGKKLFIGDVGQERREEVDMRTRTRGRGANFGWDAYEGTLRYEGGSLSRHDKPIHQYPHSSGRCSITGGYVSRDPRIPSLRGRYVFADLCDGVLRSFIPDAGGSRDTKALGVDEKPGLTSFGRDARKRMYVAQQSGDVFRIADG